MASTSETGHTNNVANFDELISYVTGYGTSYNPTKASTKLTALQALSTNAKNANGLVNAALTTYSSAVDAKEMAIAPLDKIVRRVMNFLKSSDTTDTVDESVHSIVRLLLGGRAKPKLTEQEKQALAAEGKSTKEISSSHLGYDDRIDNLDKLIKALTGIPLYAPNEADLKVTYLTTLLADLKAKNAAVIAAHTPLSNARIARHDVLYKDLTGLCDVAADTKLYIKSVFGASSLQYKQVSKLKFVRAR